MNVQVSRRWEIEDKSVYFFNTPAYVDLHQPEDVRYFHVNDKALMVVSISAGKAYSPRRATFGGVQTLGVYDPRDIHAIYRKAVAFLKEHDFKEFKIILPSRYLSPQVYDLQVRALRKHQAKLLYTDLNYHIELDNFSFDKLHDSERRRYKKAEKAGLYFEKCEHPDWKAVYKFIVNDRKVSGYPISMTRTALLESAARFPDRYLLYRVMKENQVCSLTVAVRINDEVLYNFYPADNYDFRKYSPTVFLQVKLCEEAKKEGYKYFDLGTGTEDGLPNKGLITFKKRMGAEESEKGVWRIEL